MLEFENNVLVRQLLVDRRERLSLVLNLLLTLSTEEHLDGLTSLAADGGLLANALARIHQILNDGLVDRGQRVAVGADTVELVGTAVVLAQDGSLGDEHHGATLELLLQFSGEAGLNQSESLEELVVLRGSARSFVFLAISAISLATAVSKSLALIPAGLEMNSMVYTTVSHTPSTWWVG